MGRRLKQAAVGLVVIFVASQLIRPDRTNPPTDTSRTIQAQAGTASGLADIQTICAAAREVNAHATGASQ